MNDLTRGHTPPIRIHEKNDVDFSQFDHVYVTLKQGFKTITKSDNELTIDGSDIEFTLSQAETLAFCSGKEVGLQVNVTFDNGRRGGNKRPVMIDVAENLLGKVVK